MIETINIWKRSHDGKFSVCILVPIHGTQAGFMRHKEAYDTVTEAIAAINYFNLYRKFP